MIAHALIGSMRRSLSIACCSALLLLPSLLRAQEKPSCASLKEYRDAELARAWDRATIDYTLTKDNLSDVATIHATLLSDETWAGDWAVLTSAISLGLKSETRLVGNLLRIDPATGQVTTTVSAGTITKEQVLKGIDTGAAVAKIVAEGFTREAGRAYTAQIVPVAAALKDVWDLAESIRNDAYREKQKDTLKTIVHERLDRLDARLAAYDSAMDGGAEKIAASNAVRSAIDIYCGRFGQIDAVSGTWTSTDTARRFTLKIEGTTCTWTERASGGRVLVRTVPVTVEGGQARVYRPNDQEVLAFLDFQTSVIPDILARHPEPSFLILTPAGGTEKGSDMLTGEWHGVLITKDMKGKLKEMKQPREVAGKSYMLRRE